MPASSESRVSIVLPTFNRARFLPAAFASIAGQTLADWELIVVDDGSTDETQSVVGELAAASTRPVRYHRQQNQGPSAARNAAIELATSPYVAFFDSDDLWLPHHLADCVSALEASPDVHWAYGASQIVDLDSKRELDASSFHPGGRPHPFLELSTEARGAFQVLTDERATERMIAAGLMCGLQCSVMRRELFGRVRLPRQRLPNVDVTDQIFVVLALKAGFRLGYFDRVHTIYHVHDESVSARRDSELQKSVTVIRELVSAWEGVPAQVSLSSAERRALNARLGREYFWTLGYAILWQGGRREEALEAFRHGLRLQPWNARMWKTFALARTRSIPWGGRA